VCLKWDVEPVLARDVILYTACFDPTADNSMCSCLQDVGAACPWHVALVHRHAVCPDVITDLR
jgi:hypothetical protein